MIKINTFGELCEHYKEYPLLQYSIQSLLEMKSGSLLSDISNDILQFISATYPDDPFLKYMIRVDDLVKMQREFDKSGQYLASTYKDVKPISRDDYNLALLLSFITTIHRFEIIEGMVRFLLRESVGPKNILSIGAGTGYEIKITNDILSSYEVEAFEVDNAAIQYAKKLLKYFKCNENYIVNEEFPLEIKLGVKTSHYNKKYGKIMVCEVLEHLENPSLALSNLYHALHDDGEMFVTMAINIAQEDHIYLYKNVEQARKQLTDNNFSVINEGISPVTIFPFDESERKKIFQKGNYIAVVKKN